MNPLSILFILFIAIPLLEIYLLIEVGGIIGAFPTVFMVVFTAVLGAWLLRIQGFSTLNRVRRTLANGGIPALEILEGAVLLVSGALLLTPGFFTDTIGFICLAPTFRRGVIRWALGRFLTPLGGFGNGTGNGAGGGAGSAFDGKTDGPGAGKGTLGKKTSSNSHGSQGPKTIEGEFHRED